MESESWLEDRRVGAMRSSAENGEHDGSALELGVAILGAISESEEL